MKWQQPVYSSTVAEVGYDDETQELIVVWKSGQRSAYKGVPETKAQELANAASVGKMLNDEIKPQYSHRYV